jgi:hypothetical protein
LESIKKAVKDALLVVLRCKAPQGQTWQRKVMPHDLSTDSCLSKPQSYFAQWRDAGPLTHLQNGFYSNALTLSMAPQVVAALHDLGAGELADLELRRFERQVMTKAVLSSM